MYCMFHVDHMNDVNIMSYLKTQKTPLVNVRLTQRYLALPLPPF